MSKKVKKDPRTAARTQQRRARKASSRAPNIELPDMFLGEWISRLEKSQTEVARGAGIGKSYLNTLVSQRKANPSAAVMLRISRALDLTVNDLYSPPPPKDVLDALKEMRPAHLAALGGLVSALKKAEVPAN